MTTARETVAAIVVEREKRTYRECLYCGQPTRGLACSAHRDLLTLDPHQYEMRLRGTDARA